MKWDPKQYSRYADERGRPFHDLLDRVAAGAPRTVVDLGCGPGGLTALLAQKWPTAHVVGIDSSSEMIDQAQTLSDSRVHFQVGDIAQWSPDGGVDVVISNAALQWVPGHLELLRRWATTMAPGSWLAWQVPGNFGSPTHTLMRELATSSRWSDQLGQVLRHDDAVAEPRDYAQLLLHNGWRADVWETTYLHVLAGTDPVLEWVRGTGLRPVLTALDGLDPSGRERAAFEAQYAGLLRAAYPSTENGTLLEFRRIFAVGERLT